MIDREHELPIARQPELVAISRGSVYYHPEPVSEADLRLMRRIDELHLEHPFAGAQLGRAWAGGAAGATTCSSNGCGAA